VRLIAKSPGGEREVTVRHDGDRYEVGVDGELFQVDVARVGDGLRSLLIDGVQHEVSVDRRGNGAYWVAGREGGVPVEVVDPLTHLAQVSRGGAGTVGQVQVKAYMPGRVSTVLVAVGAEVEAGQGVIVLEAMKMENEIQAEQAGTVTRIYVEPGQAVEGGDPLFDLE